jgi:hypothetical protein
VEFGAYFATSTVEGNESSSRKDCTTKASDDAAIETFVKIAFPNCLSNPLEQLHHQQYNGLYMVL